MNKYFNRILTVLFALSGVSSSMVYAQSTSEEAAKNIAKKDLVSARKKIEQDFRNASDECKKLAGPAEAACMMQASAAREVAEIDAEEVVNQAGRTAPLQKDEKKKYYSEAKKKAKRDYKTAVNKIKSVDELASTECLKLLGLERKTCKTQVARRTADAKRSAKFTYADNAARVKY